MPEVTPPPVHVTSSSTLVTAIRLFALLLLTCVIGLIVVGFDNPVILNAIASDNESTRTLVPQPYDVATDNQATATLSLEMRYFLWQNATLSFELGGDACIDRITVRPDAVPNPVELLLENGPLCGHAELDMSKHFLQGSNHIMLTLHSKNVQKTPVYITAVLFGAHANSTLACLCVFFIFVLVTYKLMRLRGFDAAITTIFVAGFIAYAMLLHVRPNLTYSNDLTGHIDYIRYMVAGWTHPYQYNGWEHFHPPFYYLLAARFFHAFDTSSVIGPLTAVRFFALLLYMTFCFFGLLTLREAVTEKGLAYKIGALLIVFWPIGPILATRISNDIAVYAAWSAAFYYLARWMRSGSISGLQWAVVFIGVTFLFKASAIVPASVLGLCILYALYTKHLRFYDMLRPCSLLAYMVLALGILGNVGRVIYLKLTASHMPSEYLSPGADEVHPVIYYLTFNPIDYVAHPVVKFDLESGFFNYFLKTIFYSEQQLAGITTIPGLLNMFLLMFFGIVVMTTVLAIRRNRASLYLQMPFIIGAVLPPFGPFIFMMLARYMFCQSFRFIVPMLIPLVVLYVRGIISAYHYPPTRSLYWAGIVTGGGIALLGIGMNLWLYTHGEFG